MLNQVTPQDIPADVLSVCRELHRHGYKAWVVGGCMRDLLRGKPASDWDLATSARPEQVQGVFKRVIPTGIQHGTVTVRLHGQSFEVTTLRGEGAYSDGRRPDQVEFVTDIEADLGRRDFTVNAIAYDPIDDKLSDPYDGLGDLTRRVIRAVGEPTQRFSEDGLRVLRAARFAATLEFSLDPGTEAAIGPTLDTFRKVSPERVREEWLKALKAKKPSVAFSIMRRTGMLAVTAPSLAALPDELFAHALAAVDLAPVDPCFRLAALFHLTQDLGALTDWLTQYRFSNAEREEVVLLVKHGAALSGWDLDDPGLRRRARTMGREYVPRVAELRVTLALAHHGQDSKAYANAAELRQRLHALITPEVALNTKELALTGRDLMTGLSLSPGPQLGKLLDYLLEAVLDDPSLNKRDTLLGLAAQRNAEGST